jgi:type III secretion protein J
MTLRCAGVVVLLLVAGCRSQIQHGLEERDANELVTVLVARGYEAQKVAEKSKKPTWAIEVEDAHATDALRVLAELKLPRPHRATTQSLTSQSSLIETPATERLRQLEAEEGDIELALEGMDGVASADVELVVPPAPRPGQSAVPSKASLLLRVTPERADHFEQQRAGLKALVAASVEGLKPDDVVLYIDQVSTVVPRPVPHPAEGVRWLLSMLAALVTVLSASILVLVMRLRRHPLRGAEARGAAAPVPSAAPARPVVSAQVQRKAA